jgi:hypothetical protein
MSRFQLYGGIDCHKCAYYGKARLNEHMRCRHPSNCASKNWLGPIYMERPEYLNWNKKCENYKEKVDE